MATPGASSKRRLMLVVGMPNCESCGGEVNEKNAAGHWRDNCQECIREVADGSKPHHELCEDDGCIVCASYREEADGAC